MEQLLEDVRKDAEEKLKLSGNGDMQPLFDAAVNIIQIYEVVRRYGKVVLAEINLASGTEYVKTILLLMADRVDTDHIIEVATNEYWTQNIQGIWAMVYYMYLQGALGICRRDGIRIIKERIILLLPEKDRPAIESLYREIYYNEIEITVIPSTKVEELKLCKEECEKRKLLNCKRMMQELFDFRPVFQSRRLIEKLHELEEAIAALSDQSIGRMIKDVEEGITIYCLYGLCNEARERILENTKYFTDSIDPYLSMPHKKMNRINMVIEMGKQSEEGILGAVVSMLSVIKCLRNLDEI